MNTTTEIVETIKHSKYKITYDEYCKKILCNKQILARIIKECVSEFHDIPLAEIPDYMESEPTMNINVDKAADKIYGMNTEDISVHGAKIIFDILVGIRLPNSLKDSIGLILNIEAQANSNTPYPLLSRAVYYCSRLLARQKNRLDGFQHSEFQNLKKVYSIWIVMNSKKATEGVMNQYSISETCLKRVYHFPKEAYDKLTVIMIYPNSKYDVNDENYSLMELLHILFKAEISAKEKKCQLEKNYGIMMIKETEQEVEGMCNLSQVHVDAGLKRGLAKGRKEGRKEGLKLGLAKGIAEGVKKQMIKNVATIMKKTNQTMTEVMDLLDIDESLRPEIRKCMKAQWDQNEI